MGKLKRFVGIVLVVAVVALVVKTMTKDSGSATEEWQADA